MFKYALGEYVDCESYIKSRELDDLGTYYATLAVRENLWFGFVMLFFARVTIEWQFWGCSGCGTGKIRAVGLLGQS